MLLEPFDAVTDDCSLGTSALLELSVAVTDDCFSQASVSLVTALILLSVFSDLPHPASKTNTINTSDNKARTLIEIIAPDLFYIKNPFFTFSEFVGKLFIQYAFFL